MADRRAIVLINGIAKQIPDADDVIVGTGVTTHSGDIAIGSATGNIALNGVLTTNVTFNNSNHTISASTSAATVAGITLTYIGATGGAANGSAAGGNGGDVSDTAGTGGAASSTHAAGNGGNYVAGAGAGGAGTPGAAAGRGGNTIILGGSAGTDNGGGGADGGTLELDGGVATGSGVNGTITLGTNFATSITIGNSSCITDANGIWNFTSTISSNIVFSGSSPDIFPAVPSTTGATGRTLNIFGGQGANGATGTPGGASGGLGLFGANGGDGTSSDAAGVGGDVQMIGGGGGAAHSGPGANGGRIFVDGGPATGSGSPGGIFIGGSNSTDIEIGHSGSTLTVHGTVVFDNPPAGTSSAVLSSGTLSCPSGAAVGNAVYPPSADNVALADATNTAKMPAIGLIKTKPTSTTCVVVYNGELTGLTGLTAGAWYYVDPATPGALTTTVPTASGDLVQPVAWARNTTTLVVNPLPTYTAIP